MQCLRPVDKDSKEQRDGIRGRDRDADKDRDRDREINVTTLTPDRGCFPMDLTFTSPAPVQINTQQHDLIKPYALWKRYQNLTRDVHTSNPKQTRNTSPDTRQMSLGCRAYCSEQDVGRNRCHEQYI